SAGGRSPWVPGCPPGPPLGRPRPADAPASWRSSPPFPARWRSSASPSSATHHRRTPPAPRWPISNAETHPNRRRPPTITPNTKRRVPPRRGRAERNRARWSTPTAASPSCGGSPSFPPFLSFRRSASPPTASAGEGRATPSSVFNPYRGDSFLWRIHAVSALLVIPQFAFSTYGLVWLIAVQGIGASAAGAIVAAAQIVGALGRMVVGGLSDRTGSRVGLMRVVAIAAVVLVAAIAFLSLTQMPVAAAIVFVLASTVSVADNGLAF